MENNISKKHALKGVDSEEMGLIITAAMMEAGMRDDQEVRELPAAIRKLKEEIEAFRTLPQESVTLAAGNSFMKTYEQCDQ